MISILLGENMIQLLLGGNALYTLYQNRKSIKRLIDIVANNQENNEEENVQPQVILPPLKIHNVSSSYGPAPHSPIILDKNGNKWYLAELGDLYVGREVLFTRGVHTYKYVGIIKEVNKENIHISSVTGLGLYWDCPSRIMPPQDLFIVKPCCVYVLWHDNEEYDVCKGEIN